MTMTGEDKVKKIIKEMNEPIAKSPLDLPKINRKVKKEKQVKLRVHLYITQELLLKLDQKCEEIGVPRNGFINLLISEGLKRK